MKRFTGGATSSALLLVALGLTACSGLGTPPAGASRQVELEGRSYQVEQITASTWTATPPAGQPGQETGAARLVQAIEKASGCKVTDSSFGQQAGQLNAQVDCGSRLKN